ncbi:protein kinase COQ8 [Sporobolomyces salmoneus]|uniref:protein kinase COQ8 n=1 Tax=Sporobolomyces salmoneus TaxID=183962 RepID=UPI003170AAF3
MNDVAAVCSGLIRLSIATRQVRTSRSTLAAVSSNQTWTRKQTVRPTPRPVRSEPTATAATAPIVVSNSSQLPHSSSSTSDLPLPVPLSKPVHHEPISTMEPTTIRAPLSPTPTDPLPKITSSPPPSRPEPSPSPPRPVEPVPEPPRPVSADPGASPSAIDPLNETTPIPPSAQTMEEQTVEINQLTSSKVPSSRLGRLMHYGGLAAGLGFGMASEAVKRTTYGSGSQDASKPQPGLLLSEANVERLVSKLSKMRGAALKLGQFMSIQDTKLLSPQLEQVLHRVQNSANYMPEWQTERVLTQDLGPDWKHHFSSFDMKPFAAASIGQVHSATLSPSSPFASSYGPDNLRVAVKVQFPGVRESISSDLSNLKWLLLATSVLPRGLYLDNTLTVLERELIQECDYEREASFGTRMGQLVRDSKLKKDFDVPKVVKELSGKMVLTTEMMYGKPLKSVMNLDQEKRDWIGTRILDLCLHELFRFRIMQTDPNWSNFLYNERTKKIELIDFGASQEYSEEFIETYGKLLTSAVHEDRPDSIRFSRELGYFTGEENDEMISAHLTSLFALAMPFRKSSPSPFPFGLLGSKITRTVREQIPVMLKHRLTPPPEETYSLNRKLSGAFLLCERLESRVDAASMYRDSRETEVD